MNDEDIKTEKEKEMIREIEQERREREFDEWVDMINEQEGKDVFEYSVFGSPNQKIGNFTQQKLTRFGGI